jgi:phenylacetate-CoA ligase
MSDHLDNREARDPQRRELDLMGHLPGLLTKALKSPGWQRHLGDLDTTQINSRAALARLPLLRKAELPALQKAKAPFGDFISNDLERFGRLFSSPGPIYEPESKHDDAWRASRSLHDA